MQKTLSFHAKLHELESSLGNQDIGEKVKKSTFKFQHHLVKWGWR